MRMVVVGVVMMISSNTNQADNTSDYAATTNGCPSNTTLMPHGANAMQCSWQASA